MPTVWLCFVSIFHAYVEAKAVLLSVSRRRCLSAAQGALCRNRPVRSDYLDQFVWDQIICLLDDGTLIQAEIDRRKEAARNSDPRRQRNETLRREQARLGNNIARLITAYHEGLVSLEQLRQKMPELNKKSQAVESELQSLETAAVDQARYLQLAESLEGFRIKLRVRAKTLDVGERQQILRLFVKEILVAADSLTIRHSIPIPQTSSGSNGPQPTDSSPSGASQKPNYLLRSRSKNVVVMRFDQEKAFIHAGETVEWSNSDPTASHTITFGVEPADPMPPSGNVTLDSDGARHAVINTTADSVHSGFIVASAQERVGLPQLPPGVTRFRVTFKNPGTYPYICAIHDELGMKGTVIVVP